MEMNNANDNWFLMVQDHVALKNALEFRGYSVEQSAKLIGVTVAKYKAYESGRYHIANAPEDVQKKIRIFFDPQGLERLDGVNDLLIE